MKTVNLFTTAIILLLLAFSSCKNANNSTVDTQQTEITEGEKETIKKAISEKIEQIIKGAKELNVDAALKPYSNDSTFKIVNPDASVTDFKTMKKAQAEAFKTVASMNFKTIKQDFTFLAKDLVICTWTGSNEFELKTGEKMKIDPYVGTMIFKKVDNEWKIIYAHETTTAPVTIETKN